MSHPIPPGNRIARDRGDRFDKGLSGMPPELLQEAIDDSAPDANQTSVGLVFLLLIVIAASFVPALIYLVDSFLGSESVHQFFDELFSLSPASDIV